MPFDALAMAAMADEVTAAVLNAQIQKIVQPSAASVALSLYGGGRQHWLLLSADARYARASVGTDRLAKAFPTPSAFIMLLRKHLEGRRVRAIEQPDTERILRLVVGDAEHEVRLVAEIMGKHSNILLVDALRRILGAIKIVPPRESRVRPILPGHAYTPPPAQDRDAELYPPGERINPALDAATLGVLLSAVPGDVPLRRALLGVLAGASPFLVDQIAARAGADPQTRKGEASLEEISRASTELYRLYVSRAWEPTVFTDARGRPDFAPYTPLNMDTVRHLPALSEAVEEVWGSIESRDVLTSTRRAVLTRIETARRAAARRAESLRHGLAAAQEAEEVKQRGQLILAYQWAAVPKSSELAIPDLQLTLPLDPRLTIQENAARTFRRYQKLRDAARSIPPLLAAAEAESDRLADLAVFAQLADAEGTLRDLEREIQPDAPQHPKPLKARGKPKRGPLRFRHASGCTALVGRSARENEEVTFRLARRDDWWLHARQRTGAHVILRCPGEASPDVLLAAAALAAHFSEGRQDTRVAVDLTAVRDVRKIPGGPPGKVTYRGERTLTVAPGVEGWTELR